MYLHDGIFSYSANTDRFGVSKVAKLGADPAMESKFQMFLYVKIADMIDNFVKMGFVKMLTSFMILLPWVVILVAVGAQMNQHAA